MANQLEILPCPNHLIHKYHFEELALGGGSNEQEYLRAMVFFYKKPGLSDEFFHEHWCVDVPHSRDDRHNLLTPIFLLTGRASTLTSPCKSRTRVLTLCATFRYVPLQE